MFCPKCGQEQAAEGPNYCSRCGFQLTEVTSLLARGGTAGEPRDERPPRDNLRRRGLRILMAALAFFVFTILSGADNGEVTLAIFGLLTFASFVVGGSLLIASWVRGRRRRRAEAALLGQQTRRVETPQPGALPPAYVSPAAAPRARFDTGELAEPPSVTEHTTRQLERESPPEREPAR